MEACFLGACILSTVALDDHVGRFLPADFVEAAHQAIWRALLRLHAAGRRDIDGAQVVSELERVNELDLLANEAAHISGLDYLERILNAVPSAANVGYYASNVADRLLRRRLFEAASAAVEAIDQGDDPREVLDAVEAKFSTLRGIAATSEDAQATEGTMPDLLTRAFTTVVDAMDGKVPPVLSTGLPSLDLKLDGGLRPGDMCIVAARPSVGKTALALQMAVHAGRTVPVVFVSLEMPLDQVTLRILSAEADVPASDLRRGTISHEQFEAIAAANARLESSQLTATTVPSMSPMDVRAQVRRLARQKPLGLLVIDYLQLMYLAKRTENRNQEISQISRLMKGLALELNVPLVLVSQLSRATEGRTEHRPRMSDLRDSGAIEQDADIILMLHREDTYHKADASWQPTNQAEICVEKQRNGATGLIVCRFKADITTFYEPGD